MLTDPGRKILDLTGALRWRLSAPAPVVFTNGVFDVLHKGHVAYLARARAEGQSLVVGLNTDASVRRLGKGDGRPLNSEQSRAFVLAGLESVDVVVLFDEATPLGLLTALAPDVLAKGADYELHEIIGADVVAGRGGRVVRIPLEAGFSTTGLIERVRRGET